MRRAVVGWLGLAAVVAVTAGCEPTVSKEDLGTVVFEVPKVAGAEKPYPMPELGPEPVPKPGETPAFDTDPD